ncbi:MAG: DUF4249 domain-containing protein [Gemmatimonadaceae bacterium]|nr:DUF4249 domain-containing protein [Gemmatimonadaceae bacterium]
MRPLAHRAAALAAVLLLASCTFGETVIAPTAPTLVVHSVLNPTSDVVEVLLEETLTGRVRIDTTLAFDPLDPIATAGGIPVAGATVSLLKLTPPTDSIRLVERFTSTTAPRSTGVYSNASSGGVQLFALVPGARYGLRIRTADGRVVRGETVIPGPVAGWDRVGAITPVPDTLDRSRDTLGLSWPVVPGARTAGVRVDTPLGPWFLFNDSTSFAFAGGLRNFFQPGLPSVFQPGHVQTISIAVVDTGFYDYYRSGNDPFGGAGIINKLEGAIGLFAGTLPMLRRVVSVTQPATTPLDAWWASPIDSLALWLETPGPTIASVSGWGRMLPPQAPATSISGLGTLRGTALRFALVNPEVRDTVGLYLGTVFADSIVGAWQGGTRRNGLPRLFGPRTYRKIGPPRPRPVF